MLSIKKHMIYVLVYILASTATISADDKLIESKGHYKNMNYLYSFTIPSGLICLGDPPPTPNHGCTIYLCQDPEAYIWVSGDYNSSESPSPSDELVHRIGPLLKEGAEISVLKRTPFVLGGLSAERLAISFKYLKTSKVVAPTVRDTVIAFRTVEGFGEIIYTVGLITPISRYKEDQKIFELILKSWETQPKK